MLRRNYETYIYRKRRFCFTDIWHEPDYTPNTKCIYISNFFQLGWVLHPIYSATGDYPPVMKEWVAKKSKEEGYSRSRLRSFTKEEIEMLKGISL